MIELVFQDGLVIHVFKLWSLIKPSVWDYYDKWYQVAYPNLKKVILLVSASWIWFSRVPPGSA